MVFINQMFSPNCKFSNKIIYKIQEIISNFVCNIIKINDFTIVKYFFNTQHTLYRRMLLPIYIKISQQDLIYVLKNYSTYKLE